MGTHILEASVEGLQLLLGELGLGLQLVQALWLMAHRGQLQFTVTAVWRTQTQQGERHVVWAGTRTQAERLSLYDYPLQPCWLWMAQMEAL